MEPVHPAVAAAARHATPSPPTPAAPVVVAPVAAAATAAAGLAPGGVALDVQIAVAVVMAQLLVAALWYILRINSGVLRAAGHSRSPRPRKTEPEPFIVPPAAATPVPTPTPPAAVEGTRRAARVFAAILRLTIPRAFSATRAPSAGKPVPEFAARPAVQPGQKAPAQFVALMDKSFQRILASIKETEWNPMTREVGREPHAPFRDLGRSSAAASRRHHVAHVRESRTASASRTCRIRRGRTGTARRRSLRRRVRPRCAAGRQGGLPALPNALRSTNVALASGTAAEVVLRAMFDMSLRANWDAGAVAVAPRFLSPRRCSAAKAAPVAPPTAAARPNCRDGRRPQPHRGLL